MSRTGEKIYFIDDVEIDVVKGCLRRQGKELHLRHKTFQVLLYLLEHHHRLVTKEEIWQRVWQGTSVTDDALIKCITEIRKALGDDARQQRLLKTVSKGGYRLVGAVREEALQPALTVIETEIMTVEVEVEEIPSITRPQVFPQDHRRNGTAQRLLPANKGSRRWMVATAMALIVLLLGSYASYRFSRSAPAPAIDLTLANIGGKKSVAVMYLNNQSNSMELDWLREGLADMLINNLSRSKKLAVLNRQQLHLLLERSAYQAGESITLQKALEIARQSRAEAIVLGSFAKLDESIRIDLQLYDGRSGELLSNEYLVGEKPGQILAQVDLLSLKIAAHLGAAPESETSGNLVRTMTNNLEAYRYYSLALEKAQGLDNRAAVELLNKAIALDEGFTMAHARIGYVYAIAWGQTAKARPYLEKAFQRAERLSDKDRLYLSAWYATTKLDWAGAIQTTREIIANYPLEVEAYLQLGRLLQGEGQYAEAVAVLRRGLTIDSQAKDLYNALGLVYSDQGNHDEAIAAHQRYVALAPGLPNAYDSLGLSYQWAGRFEDALREYNQALALNPDFEVARVHLGNTYYQQGRYREAFEQFNRYIEIAPSDAERGRGFENLALIYWRQKDVRRATEAAVKANRYYRLPVWQQMLLLTEQGNLTKAETLNQQWLEQQTNTNRGRRGNLKSYHFIRGAIALKRNQWESAIDSFKEALRQPSMIWASHPFEDCLANAYLELKRFDEAIAEYQRLLKLNPNYPFVQFHLAQAYEGAGHTDKARAAYEEFLRIWSAADSDIPEIQAARTRLQALNG